MLPVNARSTHGCMSSPSFDTILGCKPASAASDAALIPPLLAGGGGVANAISDKFLLLAGVVGGNMNTSQRSSIAWACAGATRATFAGATRAHSAPPNSVPPNSSNIASRAEPLPSVSFRGCVPAMLLEAPQACCGEPNRRPSSVFLPSVAAAETDVGVPWLVGEPLPFKTS